MKTLLTGGEIVLQTGIVKGSILIEGDRIVDIFQENLPNLSENINIIDCTGKTIIPGVIDDQVHFRQPGLTHKADIESESKAAVAGGITSFMEMPNTLPPTTKITLLEEKFNIASQHAWCNYSFYLGASNDNIDQIKAVDKWNVCGVKIFMGSSTGNMLVDREKTLKEIFKFSPILIATHCEDEETVQKNLQNHIEKYGEDIPMHLHPIIRSREACYTSSSKAVALAKAQNARLHILHISTAEELNLFEQGPAGDKQITAEACVHHLWFTDKDYLTKGSKIKWNPAVKKQSDQQALWNAVNENIIDVLATDHAPHTLEEKNKPYTQCPSGGPLVQHMLPALLTSVNKGKISLQQLVKKTSWDVASCFEIKDRGSIKKGYYADLVVVDLNAKWNCHEHSIWYKCGWTPFEKTEFIGKVESTMVNGKLLYHQGEFHNNNKHAKALEFSR